MPSQLLPQTVAGITAGFLSTIATHPLDLVKTRMQVRGGGTLSTFSSVYQSVGLNGLYRGVGTNLFGGAAGWGFYFMWYGQIKRWMGEDSSQLSSLEYLLAAAAAGSATSICTNPIWVVKTRLLTTNCGDDKAYAGMWGKSEGLRGYYRGLIASLFGVTHGALQFMAYENLKIWRKAGNEQIELGTADYLVLSASAKLLATTISYPYQVIRSRVQVFDEEIRHSTALAIRKTWVQRGIPGFYQGLSPNLLRVLPATCITMIVYEKTNKYLSD